MIDWHSHILPQMDDGSANVTESISMIEMQMSQGVDTVIATPHFYANDESVEAFLERRHKAWDELKSQLPENAPQIRLGAEVKYYQGISRLEKLRDLRIEGTRLLLLEMPMMAWTEYTIRELVEMSGKSDIKVILAHIERYLRLQKQSVWERLYESGILMQINASFLTGCISGRKAVSLLRKGDVHFIGSDCHNMTSRAPQIGKAFEILEKKLGCEYISQMNEYGSTVLAENV